MYKDKNIHSWEGSSPISQFLIDNWIKRRSDVGKTPVDPVTRFYLNGTSTVLGPRKVQEMDRLRDPDPPLLQLKALETLTPGHRNYLTGRGRKSPVSRRRPDGGSGSGGQNVSEISVAPRRDPQRAGVHSKEPGSLRVPRLVRPGRTPFYLLVGHTRPERVFRVV